VKSNVVYVNSSPSTPVLFAVRGIGIDQFGGAHESGRLTRKFLLLVLATYADRDGGKCFPGILKLSADCGLHPRSIQKVIAWLRDNGFLEVECKGGPGRTNVYTILTPQMTPPGERDELQRASCPEAHQMTPHGGRDGDARWKAHNLSIPTKRPTNKGAPSALFVLPAWVPVEAWERFAEMRRQKRKAMSDTVKTLVVQKLAKLRDDGDSPAEVLDQSTRSNWVDVWSLKRDHSPITGGYRNGRSTAQAKQDTTVAAVNKAIAGVREVDHGGVGADRGGDGGGGEFGESLFHGR
jgi:Helix-turn-helix domain